MKYRLLISLLAVWGLSACAYDIGHFTQVKGEGAVQSELGRWKEARVINLTVQNNEFSPMLIRVEAGQPYILKMLNLDDEVRAFKAPDFFDTIHYDLLQDRGRYYKTGYITSLVLEPNVPKEYYFIPIEPEQSESQSFRFDSTSYTIAIPPVHFSPVDLGAPTGAISVVPEGTFCRYLGGGEACPSAKK